MLLDDLKSLVSGLGTVQLGQTLDLPNTVIGLLETGGYPSVHVNGNGMKAVLDEPTVQVRTRAQDYPTAMALCRSAYDLLDGYRNGVINNRPYHMIRAMQPPFLLQRDELNRFICAFNVRVQRSST